MKITLLAIGAKMPAWVSQGYMEYARRLVGEIRLELVELPLAKRSKNSVAEKLKACETERLLNAVPKNAQVWALDECGQSWSTQALAARLKNQLESGHDLALLVGGPDGLDQNQLKQVETKWSLSPLTLPHPLVRIVLAEQLYRAQSLLRGHPYHRE